LVESFASFNFLYYSGALLLVSTVIVIVGSLLSPAPDPTQISGLTYGSLTDEDREEIRNSWDKWDVFGTAVVLGLVAGFYLYFSFWLG